MIVGFQCKLTKDGAPDVDLLVLSAQMNGNPPCYAIVDWDWKQLRLLAAHADLDAAFNDAVRDVVKNHPGYVAQSRSRVVIP